MRSELPEATLRLFGGTPRGGEAYRERCEALADSLDQGGAVTFEGRVEDIRDAYAAGNVVMLSSISEGFPFTLIEAMSCGRATVSTDVGGVREAVGPAGLVVPPRDPDAMAAAALELLGDPVRRAAMGKRPGCASSSSSRCARPSTPSGPSISNSPYAAGPSRSGEENEENTARTPRWPCAWSPPS